MTPQHREERRPSEREVWRLLEELDLIYPRETSGRSIDPFGGNHAEVYTLAVRQFQQERGLDAHGQVDEDTYREMIGARYRLGDRPLSFARTMLRGDDVLQLQQQLAELGFHRGNLDGIFGPITEQSLRAFQFDYALTVDGVCGSTTARALRNLLPKVTGGSASVLVSQAHRRTTGPQLAGRYIVLDPIRALDPEARGFLERLAGDVTLRLEVLGANVILAQAAHENLTSNERSTRANDVGAEIYLSLDVATNPNRHAEGVAAYYFGSPSGASQVGRELAGLLQREITARTDFIDLGEYPRVMETLRATRMPSIHLELGYLSNDTDRSRMSSQLVREHLTTAIVAGLQRFYLMNPDEYPTGTFGAV